MKHSLATPALRRTDVKPTTRELRWFAQIDRHGPQSSEFLYELTRDTHRCRDTSLRRLQALREAGYLRLPPQQRQIAKAEFNPYIYDLTPLGFDTLADEQELERQCRPTGHWWHGYWVSAVSSAIEITVTRAGLTYIPATRILAIKGADLGIPLRHTKLIPDQLFAIKYPSGFRAFALEVDRGTEPVQSKAARKSLKRSVHQYREVLEQKLHQRHYGLKSNLIVLWVFSNKRRQQQFEAMLIPDDKVIRNTVVSGSTPRFHRTSSSITSALALPKPSTI
ncbi:replication-relaxation family protein [uncultured Roseovarius sp.]|uniref:replication-relaxation family protein n=1 Tax=uncultured Roseovarius sp. TaxID=293344 RepID=UPI00261D8A22|nr:replication-relaxation family protein [uncultured Roseovarius sp.]